MHGKSFENAVKAANGIFSYAVADRKRNPNEPFDIGGADDKARGIPTSIKTTGSDNVAPADARRFWNSFSHAPYRLMIGEYRQHKGVKVFETIHEFILRPKYRAPLLGTVSPMAVSNFHNGLKRYPAGQHQEARAWAREYKARLEPLMGIVGLNYKIDSRNQRRLQCSVSLTSLRTVIDVDDYSGYAENFGSMVLPHSILSERRSA